jgi:hypothetical protein
MMLPAIPPGLTPDQIREASADGLVAAIAGTMAMALLGALLLFSMRALRMFVCLTRFSVGSLYRLFQATAAAVRSAPDSEPAPIGCNSDSCEPSGSKEKKSERKAST